MQRSLHNDVEIYNITATHTLPDGITDRRRRKLLRRDSRLNKQISLIHEFEMPNFSTHVAATPDRQCLFALGSYKPRLKCFEVANMSEKFMRGLDSLPHRICFLGEDWTRFWLLEDDRWVELHNAQGQAFRQRIPRPCRDLTHPRASSLTYFAGAGPDLYRFCLTSARFLPPLASKSGAELTACASNPDNGLVVTGNQRGGVEAWDPRDHSIAAAFQAGGEEEEVSCLRFQSALNLGVGLSSGRVLLFDVRCGRPRVEKEHHYGFPILDMAFHKFEEPKVISMDKKCVKIWLDEEEARTWAAFEPGVNLNGLYNWPNSGLIHLATESPQLLSYYIPNLGCAPKWCSLLYLMVREAEKQEQTVFEGHKFVTREELESCGLASLIGTAHLTAHLHGFHMSADAYQRLRAQVGPATTKEFAQETVKQKMSRDLEAVSVRLDDEEEEEEEDDERFRALAEDPDFAVDPNSEEAGKSDRVRRQKEKKRTKRLKQREKAVRAADMLRT